MVASNKVVLLFSAVFDPRPVPHYRIVLVTGYHKILTKSLSSLLNHPFDTKMLLADE